MGNICVLALEGGFSRGSYLFSDHRATVPSAPPLARLSAVSDCDSVACGCHATPPTRSLCAVEENQLDGAPANKSTDLLMLISEYTPARSTASHSPTNFRSPVFCYLGRTEPGLSDVGHRFVTPSSQSSGSAVNRKFLGECVDTRTLAFAKIFFRRSISLPKGIPLSIRCWATRF